MPPDSEQPLQIVEEFKSFELPGMMPDEGERSYHRVAKPKKKHRRRKRKGDQQTSHEGSSHGQTSHDQTSHEHSSSHVVSEELNVRSKESD
mmetsp:Transcript_23673/g.18106  ORF Transcript_23673/g.18106 Transcript_23673/m.18106 type:complete len:91 (-) Transcript_23673:2-274(-)